MASKAQTERKQIERLKGNLHFIGVGSGPNSHTIFLDTAQDAVAFDPAKHFDTDPSLVGRSFNRPRKINLETYEFAVSAKNALKARDTSYQELKARIRRSENIKRALRHVEHKNNMMKKGRRFKVKDAEKGCPPVFKWARKRKR